MITLSTEKLASRRDLSQNYFKGVLVIGMVIAHSLQMLTSMPGVYKHISTYVNLVTFSGFMFSFGYVYQIAYAKKDISLGFALHKMKATLFAFYISAFAWMIIVERQITFQKAASIVLLWSAPSYSEFLLAFFLMTAIYFIFRRQIAYATSTARVMAFTVLVLLLLSFIPWGDYYPYIKIQGQSVYFDFYLGLLLGSSEGHFFPILHYSIFFLAGIWFQRHKVGYSKLMTGIAISGTALFMGYYLITKHLPARFYPNPFWILGSFAFIYLYYLLCRRIKANIVSEQLNIIGENSLLYLVLSNIVLFVVQNSGRFHPPFAIATSVIIFAFIWYLISITRVPKKTTVVEGTLITN